MAAYLQTWTKGVTHARQLAGKPLRRAASDQYARMGVASGDHLYIAYLDEKRLHLIGRLRVDRILTRSQAEARFGTRVWDAEHHAVGEDGDVAVFDLRVPEDVVRGLRFEQKSGATTELETEADGSVNGQRLQSLRRLTPDSAALLDELVEDGPGPSPGPRPRLSPDQRRAVETRAMRVVQEHYAARGWDVEDVSQTRPYDLVCRRLEEERHVEVKGLTGLPLRVELTANEVVHARSNEHSVLAVVSEIQVDTFERPRADGGVLEVTDPWRPQPDRLRATAYTYALEGGRG